MNKQEAIARLKKAIIESKRQSIRVGKASVRGYDTIRKKAYLVGSHAGENLSRGYKKFANKRTQYKPILKKQKQITVRINAGKPKPYQSIYFRQQSSLHPNKKSMFFQ